ncbi:hypothetical protein PTKIN_Ptkin12aG0163700 [Pterospermum kingtungense]
MAPDASTALAVRQKVHNFLHAACTGNLDLLKCKPAQILRLNLMRGMDWRKQWRMLRMPTNKGRFILQQGGARLRTEVCKYLVEELKLDVDTKDEDGETSLLNAAGQGHTLTAKYLLDHGANPAILSDFGGTALHYSTGTGNIELLKYILAISVEVDVQSVAGTPLIWAVGHAQQDAVNVLLEHHANPNAESEDNTPLSSAVAADSLACLDLSIQVVSS